MPSCTTNLAKAEKPDVVAQRPDQQRSMSGVVVTVAARHASAASNRYNILETRFRVFRIVRLCGGSIVGELHEVNAQIGATLDAAMFPEPASVEDMLATRDLIVEYAASLPPVAGVVESDEIVSDANPHVTLRLYRPEGAGDSRPCLYWMHGGGYLFGDRRMDARRLQRWSAANNCVVVSVEYRLAPEHPYPAAVDDCMAGLTWTCEHADRLGIDLTRLGIGGASAGGGLAAAAALRARDEAAIALAFQVLVYPMIDDRQVTKSSRRAGSLIWTATHNRLAWRAYLGSLSGREVPAYAAAARAKDLSGLPPTIVAVGGIDGFVDEDLAYAQRLLHAGVATDVRVYAGAPHGFDDLVPDSAVAVRMNSDLDGWLAAQLAAWRPTSSTTAGGR
jgi:acetyl esterase/lipase